MRRKILKAKEKENVSSLKDQGKKKQQLSFQQKQSKKAKDTG